MALQQAGWGAIGTLMISVTHIVASKTNSAHPLIEGSTGTVESSGVATAAMQTVACGAKMAMHTKNTRANFVPDAIRDFTAIVGRKLSGKGLEDERSYVCFYEKGMGSGGPLYRPRCGVGGFGIFMAIENAILVDINLLFEFFYKKN